MSSGTKRLSAPWCSGADILLEVFYELPTIAQIRFGS